MQEGGNVMVMITLTLLVLNWFLLLKLHQEDTNDAHDTWAAKVLQPHIIYTEYKK